MGSILLPWQDRVSTKVSQITSQLPPHFIHSNLTFSTTETTSVLSIPSTLLSKQELAITSLKAEELLPTIAAGTYTAVEVLNAFTHRASIVHSLTHCSLDFPYKSALARAERLDAYFKETGKTVGPLHGLPVSVKDQCRVKGTETTCGFVTNLGIIDEEDSLLVQILQDAGAVIFTKTSLSTGCMWGETINNILGPTSSAYNRSFSCGGSSGGEGALLSMHGSPMGIGSDLGGSIRSPSSYNGLYGLRASNGRIPYINILNSMEGQSLIPSVVGPMTLSSTSLTLFLQTVLNARPWLHDPFCVPIPFRQEEFASFKRPDRKLRIGLMHWDGVLLPQPPVRRALREVESLLKAAGHEIVPFSGKTVIDQERGLDLVSRIFAADANTDITTTLSKSGEPPLSFVSQSKRGALTINEEWALGMEAYNFRAEVNEKWNATAVSEKGLDAVDAYIAPINPTVCPQHGDYKVIRYMAYTSCVNLLDFSSVAIPVVKVDEGKDLKDKSESVDADGKEIPSPTGELDRTIRGRYDPAVYAGMPVGLQIVGRRLEEEKVLAIAEVVEELMKSDRP